MALTPSERRGALGVALLLALGGAHDLWRAAHPVQRPLAGSPPPASNAAQARLGTPAPGGAEDGSPMDLNSASAAELDRLPGIGPVLAGRIVDYRRRHGRFARVEELLAVRGIGPRLFERLRGRVRVAAGPSP